MDGEESFRGFVRARSDALGRSAFLLTGEHYLAEDLLGTVLQAAAQRWSRVLAGEGDPDVVVRRLLYRTYLSVWRRPRAQELYDDRAREAMAEVDASDRRRALRRALSRLSRLERAALVLCYHEGKSESEAAGILGCRAGTVIAGKRNALAMLQDVEGGLVDLATSSPPVRLRADPWKRSARDRRRRRITVTAATLAYVLLVSLIVGPMLAPHLPSALQPSSAARPVPERVGEQWLVDDLPRKPGAMSLVVGSYTDGWYAVNGAGRRWRIREGGGTMPALSPDGTRLARVLGYPYKVVVDDLVTGERLLEYDTAEAGGREDVLPLAGGNLLWSPDSARLLTPLSGEPATALILLDLNRRTGSHLEVVSGAAGWRSGSQLVSVEELGSDRDGDDEGDEGDDEVAVGLVAHIQDVVDGSLRRLPLRPEPGGELETNGQQSLSVSPDGELLAVLTSTPDYYDGPRTVRMFSLSDGHELGSVPGTWDVAQACRPVGWAEDDALVVAVNDSNDSNDSNDTGYGPRPLSLWSVSPAGADADRITVVTPDLGATCAAAASLPMPWDVTGRAPLGTTTSEWSWHWRRNALQLVAVIGIVAPLWRWRATRRRRV